MCKSNEVDNKPFNVIFTQGRGRHFFNQIHETIPEIQQKSTLQTAGDNGLQSVTVQIVGIDQIIPSDNKVDIVH